MDSPIPDYLLEVLTACGADDGAVADYIPELAEVDPDTFGICLATMDGSVYAAGNAEAEFTIQSMSKPFAYALAITDRGLDDVRERVGVEPSGEAFNEMSLDPHTGRPRNPMINAGAILTHSLVDGDDAEHRAERVLEVFSRYAGRRLSVDESVYVSELSSAYRNLGMGHMLKAAGVLDGDPVAAVGGYIRQCSIRVTCRDLALMAATLANGGIQPRTGEAILDQATVRQTLSVMTTCGMYDAAGDWMTSVGIPAKSGVSGGIIGALPGQVGIAVFSPRLDSHGTSVRGVEVLTRLSRDMGMHMMDAVQEGQDALRGHLVSGGDSPVTVYRLQGDLRFAGAETVVREISAAELTTDRVALDFSRVSRVHDVARRMLLEVARRLALDGIEVVLVDPEGVVPDPDRGDGIRLAVVDSLDAALEEGAPTGG